MELPDKLRCFRIENGISQLEAAEKLEVSRQTVYRWETGTSLPSMDNLMRLSKLYNVPLSAWTDDDWTPNPLHQPPELETSILEPAIPEPEPAIPELKAQERAEPKPRKYLRWPAFGAIILTAALMAGIAIGIWFSHRSDVEVVLQKDMNCEVIDLTTLEEQIESLPPLE